MIRLDDKDPPAVIMVKFELAVLIAAGATITGTPTVAATAINRTVDANAQAIVSGAATVSGTNVLQKIIGGLPGVDYELKVTFDMSDGLKETDAMLLPVRTL